MSGKLQLKPGLMQTALISALLLIGIGLVSARDGSGNNNVTETGGDVTGLTVKTCKGNFDGDSDVDKEDLAVFAAKFGDLVCEVNDPGLTSVSVPSPDDMANPRPLFKTFSGSIPDSVASESQAVVRQRYVDVEFGLLPGPAKDLRPEVPLSVFQLNLFDDVSHTVIVENVGSFSPDGTTRTVSGRISNMPGGGVTLVVGEGVLSGNVTTPDGSVYQIRCGSGLLHTVMEIDKSMFPLEADPIPVTPMNEAAGSDLSMAADAGSDIIDVMILYTPGARIAAGGVAAMISLIDLAVAETNKGYEDSQLYQRINLVHRREVSYTEAGSNAFGTALTALQNKSDGVMDEIHGWRDQYGADIVSLIIDDSQYCGLGYLMTAESPSFESWAFSVVNIDCATGIYSMAHEMGHNQGAHHDLANSSQGSGVLPFSHGYQDPENDFRTIMAYNCPEGCPRVNYWSNTSVSYNGKSMGIADVADNRKSHNQTLDTVVTFRLSVNRCVEDLDEDGDVDGADLFLFSNSFGRSDCP